MQTIRIAGNTEVPCYLTLLEKGYEVNITRCRHSNEEGSEYLLYDYEASKPGSENRISATNIYELLALAVMGETRGFSQWQAKADVIHAYFDMIHSAPTYDMEGNLIEE